MKYPLKGDTIQFIYTDSKHSNPLRRVTHIENIKSLPPYDKEKYKEMILDAVETVLGFFGFDRMTYSSFKRNNRRNRWYEELKEQRARDIETDALMLKDLLYETKTISSGLPQPCRFGVSPPTD